jgi:hypothetical protein
MELSRHLDGIRSALEDLVGRSDEVTAAGFEPWAEHVRI